MTGVFLCRCSHTTGGAAWAASVSRSLQGVPVFSHAQLCGAEGISFAAARVRSKELTRIALAGCEALQSPAYVSALCRAAGLPAGAVEAVMLSPRVSAPEAARAVRRVVASLELTPRVSRRRTPLQRDVLVLGGGLAARETARLVSDLGYPTTLMDGEMVSLEGRPGDFSACLRMPAADAEVVREFGAVVFASERQPADLHSPPFVPGFVLPLTRMESHIESLKRRDRPRQAALVLDYRIDETPSSCATAMRAAIALRRRFSISVIVVLRDVRVAARGLETLYGEARNAGATFLKHEGAPGIVVEHGEVRVSFKDAVTGEEEELLCGLAGVSEAGLFPRGEQARAAAAGLGLDGYGRLQENNVHLLPVLSNRAGVFILGPDAGEREMRDAAFSVHSLLSPGTLDVAVSQAVVDGEKCALCLTCVRACPFNAMRVDDAEKKADCIPESCRGCGICASACPAKAITLPLHSSEILMARAGR
ncbi:MAG TPA: 4Fe-4S binding protein [Spirochaetia bacterium]|nr:4Fe-4S binding protein [Spirochaetia bacterium]